MNPNRLTDDERFARIIGVFCITFDIEATADRLEAYRIALSDIPLPLLAEAAEQWLRTEKWFPKPAELRTLVEDLKRRKPVPESDRKRAVEAHADYVARRGELYRAARQKRLGHLEPKLVADDPVFLKFKEHLERRHREGK